MSSHTSISPDKLARLIGTAKTPALIVAFDIENVFWSHRGERCTFDVMRWCRDATGETHNWPTNKAKP